MLHRNMEADAYIRKHSEMVQREVNSFLEREPKTVADIFTATKMNPIKRKNKSSYKYCRFFSSPHLSNAMAL